MYDYALDGLFGIGIIVVWVIIISLLIDITLAIKMCKVAKLKGYNTSSYHIFGICFWFGLFGYIYVLALPDLALREALYHLHEDLQKKQAE